MEVCQHKKVFADYILTSNPPKIPWICSICGQKGNDQFAAIEKGISYDEVNKLFYSR